MTTTLPGRRIYVEHHPFDALPGDYWYRGGHWYGTAPNGLLCALYKHDVTEHPDHTITVSPSIAVWMGLKHWHGFLVHGVWTDA